MTDRHDLEQAIAADLSQCDLIMATMSKRTKQYKMAKAHRAACFAEMASWMDPEIARMTNDELLAALAA